MPEPTASDVPWVVDYVRVQVGSTVHVRWSRPLPGLWGGQESVTLVGPDLGDVAQQAAGQGLPAWSDSDVGVDEGAGLGTRPRPLYPGTI